MSGVHSPNERTSMQRRTKKIFAASVRMVRPLWPHFSGHALYCFLTIPFEDKLLWQHRNSNLTVSYNSINQQHAVTAVWDHTSADSRAARCMRRSSALPVRHALGSRYCIYWRLFVCQSVCLSVCLKPVFLS